MKFWGKAKLWDTQQQIILLQLILSLKEVQVKLEEVQLCSQHLYLQDFEENGKGHVSYSTTKTLLG